MGNVTLIHPTTASRLPHNALHSPSNYGISNRPFLEDYWLGVVIVRC